MGYECKVIADSLAPSGVRLTTLQVTFPRFILAEFNTHRDFSRNSASSRAIPVEKMIDRVMIDPFIPAYWGKNQKGMQADQELLQADQQRSTRIWLDARDRSVQHAQGLIDIGVHKQTVNRLLEPFLWHTAIVSATRWSNFFAQRCHPDAQPEIRQAAEMMMEAIQNSDPIRLREGGGHLPYITVEERPISRWGGRDYGSCDGVFGDLRKLSVARCARVSYLSQDGKRDHDADFALYDRLVNGMHWSPFEHVAMAMIDKSHRSGNFHGWNQFRKTFPEECR